MSMCFNTILVAKASFVLDRTILHHVITYLRDVSKPSFVGEEDCN